MDIRNGSSAVGHDPELTASFLSAFRRHPAGVAVITGDAGEGPVAFTATSVSSLSAEPPIVMFSASVRSSSTPTIRRAETVVIHLLDEDDLSLAQLCATSGIDRFADGSSWERLPTGEVRFHGAASWMRSRVLDTFDVEGSLIVVAEVLEAGGRNTVDTGEPDGRPLVYHARTWHALDEASRIIPPTGEGDRR